MPLAARQQVAEPRMFVPGDIVEAKRRSDCPRGKRYAEISKRGSTRSVTVCSQPRASSC